MLQGSLQFPRLKISLALATLSALLLYGGIQMVIKEFLLWIPAIIVILTTIGTLALLYDERNSKAWITDNWKEIVVRRTYCFGVLKKTISFQATEEFTDFIEAVLLEGKSTFSIPSLDKATGYSIVFQTTY